MTTRLIIIVTFLAVLLLTGCSKRQLFDENDSPAADETTTQEMITGCSDALTDLLSVAGRSSRPTSETGIETILITYQVSGEVITVSDVPPVDGSLEALQEDTSLHAEVWRLVTDIIPANQRADVIGFQLFSDGPGGVLGSVEQVAAPGEWTIGVDIKDASDLPGFTLTLIHEIAHLITLDSSQVDAYLPLYEDPMDDVLFARGEAACDSYFLPEGCTHPDSYLNQFFTRFWVNILDEWLEIQGEDRVTQRATLLMELYKRNASDFVSPYAVTSPAEDIAESFLYYTLSVEPAGDNLSEEKMLFFYDYPELVNLRTQIRTNLCKLLIP